MSLGLGRGAELQQPMAIAVIGGLLLATFLTLILIPLVYEMAESRRSEQVDSRIEDGTDK
jgi:HAE1 family hydrophobic/amphiphilic exporter-1